MFANNDIFYVLYINKWVICFGNIANYWFLYFKLLQSDIITTVEGDDVNNTSDDTEAGCEDVGA